MWRCLLGSSETQALHPTLQLHPSRCGMLGSRRVRKRNAQPTQSTAPSRRKKASRWGSRIAQLLCPKALLVHVTCLKLGALRQCCWMMLGDKW